MSVPDWSTDPSANGSVGGINIAENCPAGNVNNALREIMAQIAQWVGGAPFQPNDATLAALAGVSVAADQILYSTGADAFATSPLTAFARSLLDDADAATACATLGAVRVAAVSVSNPGFVRFQVGPNAFVQLAWGTLVCPGASSTSVGYAASFPNASFPVCSGSDGNPAGQRNPPEVIGGSANQNGFSVMNASAGAVSAYYVALGY